MADDDKDNPSSQPSDLNQWTWKAIKKALNGGVALPPDQERDATKNVADPQTFWNAGNNFGTAERSLEQAQDTFRRHTKKLNENWKGPTADSFNDFMLKFQGTLDGHVNAIKGPPDYPHTLTAQGDTLYNSVNQIDYIDYDVSNKVINKYIEEYNADVDDFNHNPGRQWKAAFTFGLKGMPKWDPPWKEENGFTTVYPSHYDWAVRELESRMRPVIGGLDTSYKVAVNDLREPQAVNYPGSNNHKPPPPKPPPPPDGPPPPPDGPPPPDAPPPPPPPPPPPDLDKLPPPPNVDKLPPPANLDKLPPPPQLDKAKPPPDLNHDGLPDLGHLPSGAAGIGPHGELLGADGKPLLGPNGELLGPDGRPLRGPNGELLGADGKPLRNPNTKLADLGGLAKPADLAKLPGMVNGRLPNVGEPGGPSLPSLNSLRSGDRPLGLGLPGGGAGGLGKLGGAGGLGRLGGSGKLGGPLGGAGGRLGKLGAKLGEAEGEAALGRGLSRTGERAGPYGTNGKGGSGGMPYGGQGHPGGAGGGKDDERERTTWLLEDDDVWGAGTGTGSGVLGRPDFD
ncbi:MAG: hypothetical protein V7637_698 [Mycobacteriales bacterium]